MVEIVSIDTCQYCCLLIEKKKKKNWDEIYFFPCQRIVNKISIWTEFRTNISARSGRDPFDIVLALNTLSINSFLKKGVNKIFLLSAYFQHIFVRNSDSKPELEVSYTIVVKAAVTFFSLLQISDGIIVWWLWWLYLFACQPIMKV